MKTRMILGVIFQSLQFLILMSLGFIFLLKNVSITENTYMLIFGGITLLGMNILSFVMIFTGMDDDTPRVKKEFTY